MFEKLLHFYNQGSDINVRYRSRALLKVDLGSCLFFLIFTGINLIEGDLISAIIELTLVFVFLGNIILLKKGYYKRSVNMILIICFLAAVLIVLSEPAGLVFEGYKIFTFTMPTLVALTLFGYNRKQAYIFLISGELFILYSLLFRAIPAGQLAVSDLVSMYIPPMLLFVICNFFVVQVIGNSTKIFGSMILQEKDTARRFKELNKLVENFRGNLNLGKSLHDLAENTSINSDSIKERLSNMDSVLSDLREQINSSSESQDDILYTGAMVREGMGSQTETLKKSTDSVEEITQSIRHLSDTMETAVSSLNDLKEESAQSEIKIREAGRMMDTMLESNKKINEITSVIEDVGSQTNLLAMNASIEAAHAGEVGKGFSVVAAEIRKLAETTNAQSRQIRDLLEISNNNSQSAVQQSRDVLNQFTEIMQKIEKQSKVMSGVYDSLSELSGNAVEISDEVVSLGKANSSVNSSVQNMSSRIEESHDSVRKTKNLTLEVVNLMTDISKATESLSGDARTLAEIGKKNTENLQNMESELQMLH